MLKVTNFMMETSKFSTILLLYCVYIAYCYPQNSHDEFVVKKFEDKFHAMDHKVDAKEELPTSGPYQINIPLRIDAEDNEGKIDIATIKSPMKTHKNEQYGIDRNAQEIILKDLPTYYDYLPKPLNERPLELTWLAWLLEDQNQSEDQLNSDEVFRGRIMPKHIFDPPTFAPTCATGYTLDHTGKCAKIIILNEDGLSKFWGGKVKDKIGVVDYPDDGEGELPTPSPYQIKLRLASDNEYSRTGAHVDVIMPLTFFGEVTNFEISDSKGDERTQDSLKTTENYPATVTVNLLDSEKTSTVTADLSSITTTNPIFFTSTDNSEDSTSSNEGLPTTTINLFISNTEITTLAPKPQIESSSSNLIPFPDQPKNQNILDSASVNFPHRDVSFQTEVPSSAEQTTRIRENGNIINEFNFPKLLYNGKQRTIIPGKKRRKYNRRNPNKRNNVFSFPSVKSAQL